MSQGPRGQSIAESRELGMFPLTAWSASGYPHAAVVISITQAFHWEPTMCQASHGMHMVAEDE